VTGGASVVLVVKGPDTDKPDPTELGHREFRLVSGLHFGAGAPSCNDNEALSTSCLHQSSIERNELDVLRQLPPQVQAAGQLNGRHSRGEGDAAAARVRQQ
jgi:hypothetical protein